MRQPKFKGFSRTTGKWHTGFGWFKMDLTEEYLQANQLPKQARLLSEENEPIDCDLSSMVQMVAVDKEGNEFYYNDIIQSKTNDKKSDVVTIDDDGSLVKRHHYVKQTNGVKAPAYSQRNIDTSKLKVVGTVYEKGLPLHIPITKNCYEVHYIKMALPEAKEAKFKGYSRETGQWETGFGWFDMGYTEEYLKTLGTPAQALLFRADESPVMCDLESMGQCIERNTTGIEFYTNDIIQPLVNPSVELVLTYNHQIRIAALNPKIRLRKNTFDSSKYKLIGTMYNQQVK